MAELSVTSCWICNGPFSSKGRQKPQVIYCKVQPQHAPIHRECCPGKCKYIWLLFSGTCDFTKQMVHQLFQHNSTLSWKEMVSLMTCTIAIPVLIVKGSWTLCMRRPPLLQVIFSFDCCNVMVSYNITVCYVPMSIIYFIILVEQHPITPAQQKTMGTSTLLHS